ncbi:MAG: ABC-ATPase domain-containing protein [Leptotrichia wadei]|uniref:ABC-ATPase domain-containing protein n=1 Tax=Leptotrichia wadei TaxID=157687 RepID=UPI0026EFF754|nr:ABC-ATPase domain-containing protein [Leptotrichia wadei]MBS6019985.1 ABC-ATPase domain-containing protein [Leptotrichia wadei]
MKNYKELEKILFSMDGKSYSAYKSLKGEYKFPKYVLAIDHVQSDPYAPPSRMRIIMDRKISGIPYELTDTKEKNIAVSDFLTRNFYKEIQKNGNDSSGTGGSGRIFIDKCGQEILERTSVLIKEDKIEVRFEMGMPARGRRIMGKAAQKIIFEQLPKIVEKSIIYDNLKKEALKEQIVLVLDQEYIRKILKEKGLVTFVANDSILPRENGISDKPMKNAVKFKSPEKFEITLNLPSGKEVSGMGIPKGITLIVGGGYHGKSTLLASLERGIYNHVAQDGREFIISETDAVKIRAEDGRNVEKVNISGFINNLPGNKDTRTFSTENASGSTSQAANVAEALEYGTSLLLIDEDTSATNFMIRDGRMQKLVVKEKEPITPFIDRVKELYDNFGISTILIVGGSGDYFDVANHVIMMDEYVPKDVTEKAKKIAKSDENKREFSPNDKFQGITQRIPLKKSFSQSGKLDKTKAKGKYSILYGKELIDISGLEQLVDDSQTNCIAVMVDYFKNKVLDEKLTLSQAADRIYEKIKKDGLDSISSYTGHPGNLALPRKQEFCGAVNRYRKLKIK